ncbi:MAG: hypothetical protein ACPLXO_03460 [Desulfurella sp.]|uniref:hypothetical protein n=1 Tax=Desulfurella sp. TaxID=1962857 RepID=UPI003C9A7F65
MINENGIIVKKTHFQNINFVKIITTTGSKDAVIYGNKQINLVYIFNFDFIESNKKNIYIVRKFYLADKFEHLNTKDKLMAAFFIVDIASQIDISYNFLVKTIKSLKNNNVNESVINFLKTILLQNGIYTKDSQTLNKLILELENYLGKRLRVKLDEMLNTAR